MIRQKKSNNPSDTFGQNRMKVPALVRYVLLGFGVNTAGIGIWLILATYVPVPLSVLGMLIILLLFMMYFGGKWKPVSTQAFRRSCMRRFRLKKEVWIWGLTASAAIVILLQSGLALTFRFHEFQPEIFKTSSFLNDYPAWAAWAVILTASMTAGICEEVGFRGYMQKPLEQRYGPLAGITVTSLVFVVVHLHQAWAIGMLPGVFAISFILGYLAYSTDSLLPGIIAHTSFDVVNFAYWWSDVLGTFEHKPVSMTGPDGHFILTLSAVAVSMIVFLVCLRKLLKLKRSEVSDIRPGFSQS